jgi:ATP-dependent DNA helicase RecQ
MEKEQRAKHQEMFLRDDVKIIVATIAFGMGIDKSNVRYVVHMDLPKNIESYYQETGRAGRDGLDSEALLFYSYGDVSKMKKFVAIANNPEQTEISLRKLDQMAAFGDLTTCRRKYLLNYFDEAAPDQCGNCDVCLSRVFQTDGTIQAQKVLSAISRLQERFGAGYIVDFLRGSKTEKIREEHRQLKTFGIGADISKEDWSSIIRDLLSQHYLVKSDEFRPVLRLTEKSALVLKGDVQVMITKLKEKINVQDQSATYETALFQQLKDIRRQLASLENVPAYIVLSDATLVEIAMYLPTNKEDLQKISGFGDIKIEKYGKQFAEIVSDYCETHDLASRIHLKAPKRTRREAPELDSETKQQSLELFKKGMSIEQIAELRQLGSATIGGHLAFYIKQGKIGIDGLMDTDKIKTIQSTIDRLGSAALTPIKESLGELYSFGDIRMVIAHVEFLKQHNSIAEHMEILT